MAINSGFSHKKWWFSIAMLVYQRVIEHASLTASQWYSRWLPSKPAFLGWKVRWISWTCSGWVVWESDAICKPLLQWSYRWLTNTLPVCKVSNSPQKGPNTHQKVSVWESSALAGCCQFAAREFRQEKLRKCCEMQRASKMHQALCKRAPEKSSLARGGTSSHLVASPLFLSKRLKD